MSDEQSAPVVPSNGPTVAPNRSTVTRRAVLGGSVAGLAALAGCTGAGGEVVLGKRDESESTYELSTGSVAVDADYGSVVIRNADRDDVRVRSRKSGSLLASLSAVSVSSRLEGDTVVVETTRDGNGFLASAPNVDVRVDVPSGVDVASMAVENGDAVVDGVGLRAAPVVQTHNGDAVARNVEGEVTVVTRNGDAVADAVDGFASARSKNGDAVVRDCAGIDGAETTNGDAVVDVTGLRADTSVRSENGDVVAALGSAIDAAVTARAENGSVTVQGGPFDVETETESFVEGTAGAGTHELRLLTTNGDVTVSSLA